MYENLIFKNDIIPLSTIAFHADVECIERYFPTGFPLHTAIHKITEADRVAPYTQLHVHDNPELNIIIGEPGELEYEIKLGEEVYTVKENSSIWIPSGVYHAANVIRGNGYYIAIRL